MCAPARSPQHRGTEHTPPLPPQPESSMAGPRIPERAAARCMRTLFPSSPAYGPQPRPTPWLPSPGAAPAGLLSRRLPRAVLPRCWTGPICPRRSWDTLRRFLPQIRRFPSLYGAPGDECVRSCFPVAARTGSIPDLRNLFPAFPSPWRAAAARAQLSQLLRHRACSPPPSRSSRGPVGPHGHPHQRHTGT